MKKTVLACVFLLLGSAAQADVYVLGSSYSWDALPQLLDDWPQWHIDCGKPLEYIYDNPLSPCVGSSTIWPVALSTTQFSHIAFQPVAGAGVTRQSDLDTIGYWISLQPEAVVVIHPTWPRPSGWEETFHDPDSDHTYTNYSRAYYYDLIDKLQEAFPGRTIVSDRINEMLDSIYHDIESGIGPLTDFRQMFRDENGHASDYGKYLLHNALNAAFEGRLNNHAAPYVEQKVSKYLDAKVRCLGLNGNNGRSCGGGR